MSELYDLLSKNNLTSNERIIDFCNETDFTELQEITIYAFSVTNNDNLKKQAISLFNFSASLSLSGSNFPCSNLVHRLDRVGELSRFAAMYSDKVTVFNPFDFAYLFIEKKEKSGNYEISNIEEAEFRSEASAAFCIALFLKPLVVSGIVNYSTTMWGVCHECHLKIKELEKESFKEFFTYGKDEATSIIKSRSQITILPDRTISVQGLKSVIGANLLLGFRKVPEFITQTNIGKVDRNNIAVIDYVTTVIAVSAANSLLYQKVSSPNSFGQTYLTGNEIEKTILDNSKKISAPKNLTHIFANDVPVVQIPIERVLEIRQQYQDSFKEFQSALSNLLRDADRFENQDTFNAYVKTSLSKMLADLIKIQEEGRKKLIAKGRIYGGILGLNIGLSLYSNIDFFALVGIYTALIECKQTLSEADDLEKDLKNNPAYFYFKTMGSINILN